MQGGGSPLFHLVLKGRSMRRLFASLGVVGFAAALVFVPSAAQAATIPAPPGPVQEYPYKPSDFVRSTSSNPFSTGTPLTPEQIAERNLRYGLVEEARQQRLTPQTATQPAAPPKRFSRGLVAGGGLLTLVTFAPVLVNGGLQIVGSSSEVGGLTAEEIVCGSIGPTNDSIFMSWLYGSTDCNVSVGSPNADVSADAYYALGPYHGYNVGRLCPGPIGPNCSGNPWIYSQCVKGALAAGDEIRVAWFGGGFNTLTLRTGSPFTDFCNASGSVMWFGQSLYGAYQEPSGVTWQLIRPGQPTITTSTLVQPETDPERQTRCNIEWSDGSTTSAAGLTYRESEGMPFTSAALGCEELYAAPRAPSVVPERIRIESEQDGGAITEIADYEIPSEAVTPKPSRGLRLERVVGTVAKSCMTWEVNCADWWEESEQGADSSEYRCYFGEELIDLAECGVYRRAFEDPENVRVVDPETGEDEQPWGTGPDENTTNPGSGPTPGDRCMASWAAAANPIEWVLTPIKCALVWAFVPRMANVQGTVNALGQAAGDVAAVGSLAALLETLPTSGGCGGIPVELTFFGQTASGTLLEACDGFGATAAAVVNGLLTLGVATGAVLAIIRYAAAVFGFVGPGGQLEQTQYMAMQRAARND